MDLQHILTCKFFPQDKDAHICLLGSSCVYNVHVDSRPQKEVNRHAHSHHNHECTHPLLLNLPCIICTRIASHNRPCHHQEGLRPEHDPSHNKDHHCHAVDKCRQ